MRTLLLKLLVIHLGCVVFVRAALLPLRALTLICLKPVASSLRHCDKSRFNVKNIHKKEKKNCSDMIWKRRHFHAAEPFKKPGCEAVGINSFVNSSSTI